MCVAVFKPAGADTPPLSVLKECWDKNPDGAGLAVSERKSVYYRKGFMKFSELEDFYYANNLPGRVGQAMVFHFRIGTHGRKDAGNTHPFCISDDPSILRTLTGRVSVVVAHNGVFHDEPKLPKISDTGQFVVNCETESGGDPVAHWKKHPETVGWSKLVVLYPANRFKLLGNWSIESSDSCGCLFSNLYWKPTPVFTWSGFWDGYSDCGDADEWCPPQRATAPVAARVRLKVKEVCRACEGTGIAPTGRVRCPACGGYGHSWVSKPETAAAADKDPKPLTGKTPVDAAKDAFAEAAGGRFDRTVKVWSKERKDFVVAVE